MGHGHDHGHGHGHGHDHGKAFAISVALNVGFVVVEVVYGFLADSVALMADAAHNLSDVLGLLLAWGAMRLATREPCERRTYGWRKSTIFAAFLNAVLIMLAVGAVAWEAIGRIGAESAIDGWTMIIVAAIGVVINAVSAALFFVGRHADANIRGAFLHLVADAAVSVGVVVAGAVVLWTGWQWVDPATSLAISVVVVAGTWGLLRESANLLLDAVPQDLDLAEIRAAMASIDGVVDVHDLHVWAMSTRERALTAHVVTTPDVSATTVLGAVEDLLRTRFHLEHTTLQIEPRSMARGCEQGRAGHV